MREHLQRLGHLLWDLSFRVTAMSETEFAALDLSRAAQGMLDGIAANPGISIAEIAREVPKTQQAVSQVVARLESLGFVERKLISGRTVGLYITPAGSKIQAEGSAIEQRVEKRLQALLGHDKYERLLKQLVETRAAITDEALPTRPRKRR